MSVKDGEVFINDAKVIITDIMAKNGIIHVIDTVLLP
ncbi:fasciclin domain-containing protein [Clostridioides difficile]|nr:fasciclin domain-containing protein [Clostridioides difficile]MDC9467530.1 fasciclin domain-containing protein [Clostridioides difficile]